MANFKRRAYGFIIRRLFRIVGEECWIRSQAGEWTHIYGGIIGRDVVLFANGQRISQLSPPAFKGTVSDVAIYERALTPEEIKQRQP